MSIKQTIRKPADKLLGPALGSITELTTTRREVVLTFDDGPLPGVTEKIAEVLADHGASATFFVLMTRVERAPGMVKDLVTAGHEIALHGLDHRRLNSLPPREAAQWLTRSHGELSDLVGEPVQWFRPPHGAQSVRNRIQSARLGMTTVLWSGTTWDWKDVSHEQRLHKAGQDARPGAIVLAHDGGADASDLASELPVEGVDKPKLLDEVLQLWASDDLRAVSLAHGLVDATAVRRLSFSK